MHSSLKFAASTLVTLLLLHTPTAMAGAEERQVAVDKLLKLEQDNLLGDASPLADMITGKQCRDRRPVGSFQVRNGRATAQRCFSSWRAHGRDAAQED
jgi:hypothetical protein